MVKRMLWKTFECLLATATLIGLFAICWALFGMRATCIIAGFEIAVFTWFGIEFCKAPIIRSAIDAEEELVIEFFETR